MLHFYFSRPSYIELVIISYCLDKVYKYVFYLPSVILAV